MSKKSDSATFHLAVLRTELANSSTLMSHMRASIGLLISAFGFMKLFDSYLLLDLCGWIFILMAVTVSIRGVALYRKTKSRIRSEGSWFVENAFAEDGFHAVN